MLGACVLLAPDVAGGQRPVEQQSRDAAEYLVALRRPSADFARQVEIGGGRVLDQSKSGLLWLVSIPPAKSEALQRVSDVKQVQAAVSVLIEFDAGAGDLTGRIETLGGLVTERYANVPALAAAIPFGQMAAARSLPGVKRVKKQKSFVLTAHPRPPAMR